MDVLDTLKGGLEKVEEGWTKLALARDKDGAPRGARDSKAVEWCIAGAFLIAGDGSWGNSSVTGEAMKACAAVLPEGAYMRGLNTSPWERMVEFNNAQETVEPVAEIIKKAIKAKEAELTPA